MQITSLSRVSLISVFVCILTGSLITPVIAHSTDKQYTTNQLKYYYYKKRQYAEKQLRKKNRTKHNNSTRFQQPPVLDSRFPNSYKQYEYYLKQKEESYKNR
jgi:hypothetical protein